MNRWLMSSEFCRGLVFRNFKTFEFDVFTFVTCAEKNHITSEHYWCTNEIEVVGWHSLCCALCCSFPIDCLSYMAACSQDEIALLEANEMDFALISVFASSVKYM